MWIFVQIGILLSLVGVNIYLSSFILFDPIYTLVAHILIILYGLFFLLFLIKPNLLKFKNYILAFLIIIITTFNIGYGLYISYVSIVDQDPTTDRELEICAKDLVQQWNFIDGQQDLYYRFHLCDKNQIGSPIITDTKLKIEDYDEINSFDEFDMVYVNLYETSGQILSIGNDKVTINLDPHPPYYLLIIILLPILMTILNQKNISKNKQKKLTADEEYALYLLGKEIPQEEPETFLENLKVEWGKLFNRSSKKNEDEDE